MNIYEFRAYGRVEELEFAFGFELRPFELNADFWGLGSGCGILNI